MHGSFLTEMSGPRLDAVAFEIATWPNLDDYFGLTNRLRDCGYSILEIGATQLDALIDEERAARETRH
jgi:tryptophan synthase alpha subunit